ADAKINSYVGVKYQLPLATVPLSVVDASETITVYMAATTADRMTQITEDRYKDIITWLRDVAKGTASLGIDNDVETSIDNQDVWIEANERVFTRRNWRCL